MRRAIMVTAALILAACGPSQVDGWTQTSGAGEVALSKQETKEEEPFRLVCTKTGPTLTFTAGSKQVGMSNMAAPYALVAGGATFPAELVAGSDAGKSFSVTAPLTAELLAAVRDSTTVRISVNDGYAFAESAIDTGQVFEKFAADCGALTGVTAK